MSSSTASSFWSRPSDVRLVPPRLLNREQAIEFIREDELVDVTPQSIRLHKKVLKSNQR